MRHFYLVDWIFWGYIKIQLDAITVYNFHSSRSVFIRSYFRSIESLIDKIVILSFIISLSISFSVVLSAFLSDEVKQFTFKKIGDNINSSEFSIT